MAIRTTRSSSTKRGSEVAAKKAEDPIQQVVPAKEPKKSRKISSATKTAPVAVDVKQMPNSSRKRKRQTMKNDDDEDDIKEDPSPPTNRQKGRETEAAKLDLEAGAKMAETWTATGDAQSTESTAKMAHRAKQKNQYSLAPGESPYPSYPHPTPEECREVNRILESVHGQVRAPKKIPTPSLNSSGCGEVPSVLDALIRTRLSAATNGANSGRAFRGLVEKFGLLNEGVGRGSVDWNKVRLADQKDVFTAIQSGGLADVKSKDIKKILQMVYEENQERSHKLKDDDAKASVKDEDGETAEEKHKEIAKADSSVVSLDHLHLLSSEDAFQKLLSYPGIGPKTASCVLLFCLQRPSFAVDTHVFRLVSWLGWVPTQVEAQKMANAAAAAKLREEKSEKGGKSSEKKAKTKAKPMRRVSRETTYAHCDVRVPDELKYSLHYLLIKHGKECPWCSARMGNSARLKAGKWKNGCPLDHLMKRVKKSGGGSRGKGHESSGLSELESGEEYDEDFGEDVQEEEAGEE